MASTGAQKAQQSIAPNTVVDRLCKLIVNADFNGVSGALSEEINLNCSSTALGDTPLRLAVMADSVDIVGALLGAGADPHYREDGLTALEYAQVCGMDDIVAMMVRQAGLKTVRHPAL